MLLFLCSFMFIIFTLKKEKMTADKLSTKTGTFVFAGLFLCCNDSSR